MATSLGFFKLFTFYKQDSPRILRGRLSEFPTRYKKVVRHHKEHHWGDLFLERQEGNDFKATQW
jgi:hypothetical protein